MNQREFKKHEFEERALNAPISETTREALRLKAAIQDLEQGFIHLYESIYGDIPDNQTQAITDALDQAVIMVNDYIVDSITNNMSYYDFTEI